MIIVEVLVIRKPGLHRGKCLRLSGRQVALQCVSEASDGALNMHTPTSHRSMQQPESQTSARSMTCITDPARTPHLPGSQVVGSRVPQAGLAALRMLQHSGRKWHLPPPVWPCRMLPGLHAPRRPLSACVNMLRDSGWTSAGSVKSAVVRLCMQTHTRCRSGALLGKAAHNHNA